MTGKLRFILIGCSKTKPDAPYDKKRGGRLYPQEMYGGPLFPKRVAYAERVGVPWRVLSAKYGVWNPTQDMKPYDETLAEMNQADRSMWALRAASSLINELWEPWEADQTQPVYKPSQLTVEIHAGEAYSQPLAQILEVMGVNVELPCKGLGIGLQIQLYTSGPFSPKAC